MPVETLTAILRVLFVALPVVTWLLIYWLASSQRRRRAAGGDTSHVRAGGVALRRTATGGFEEIDAIEGDAE
jgi:hypothetical protein